MLAIADTLTGQVDTNGEIRQDRTHVDARRNVVNAPCKEGLAVCHHLYGYHMRYQEQRPRMLWRCGTCGRESSKPLDCCYQPDFAMPPRPGLVRLALQGLATVISRLQPSQRRRWRRRSDVGIPITVGTLEQTPVMQAEVDRETAAENTPVSV